MIVMMEILTNMMVAHMIVSMNPDSNVFLELLTVQRFAQNDVAMEGESTMNVMMAIQLVGTDVIPIARSNTVTLALAGAGK